MREIRQNDKLIKSSYGKEIRVWDIKEIIKVPNSFKYPNENNIETPIKCLKKFLGHNAPIPSICPLKDGRFASCSWDETIIIWNIQ
jgi:WD40 repeat protein